MFFRKRKEGAQPPANQLESPGAAAAEADPDPRMPEDEEPEEGLPEGDPGDPDVELRERAEAVIPGGASTGSKRFAALHGESAEFGPTHFISASGCEVLTAGGAPLIDCTMALGSVALGYAEPEVSQAVMRAIAAGNVCGLSSEREIALAERLCDVIPCAESVRFMKTGAEAVAAAVRIARTYTGRDHVIVSGYFGWLDWSSDAAGIPKRACADVTRVAFDDVGALERAVAASENVLAAIVLEPVVERMPSESWIRTAREACDRAGAVLIFDEIKTGFRIRLGGFQEFSGVKPDLATFGKAMANGFPLSAVVGNAEVMRAATRTWISSTLAGEASALAAAGAVLDWHEKAEVCESLWSTGGEMRAAVQRAVTASGASGISVEGIDPMWLIRFDDPVREARFLAHARSEGVLFKRGAYNYAALAHDEDALVNIERAASSALVALLEEEAG